MQKISDDILVKFSNKKGDTLRGVLTPGQKSAQAVLFCAGFERPATTEKKFVLLARSLVKFGIPTLRFDYTGLGLSEGDFSEITVKSMADDIEQALTEIQREKESNKITVIAHSLGGCAIARLLPKLFFYKIVLISPSFNQRDLYRYWYAKSVAAKDNPGIRITWENYRQHVDEERFRRFYSNSFIDVKHGTISNAYFQENMNSDYADELKVTNNILYIHGDADDDVPIDSLKIVFKNSIIVKGGDHDLDKPRMLTQWLDKAIIFIKEENH